MAWTYRKKLVCVQTTQEEFDALFVRDEWRDWFYDQVEQGLADSGRQWFPHQYTGEYGWTTELLVTDQTQADAYIKMGVALGESLACPISYSIEDVDIQLESYEDM